MLGRIFVAILVFAFGFLIMKYAWQIEQWTGQSDWGQKYFGGTNNFIKLIGLAIIVGSLMHLFGFFNLFGPG